MVIKSYEMFIAELLIKGPEKVEEKKTDVFQSLIRRRIDNLAIHHNVMKFTFKFQYEICFHETVVLIMVLDLLLSRLSLQMNSTFSLV